MTFEEMLHKLRSKGLIDDTNQITSAGNDYIDQLIKVGHDEVQLNAYRVGRGEKPRYTTTSKSAADEMARRARLGDL